MKVMRNEKKYQISSDFQEAIKDYIQEKGISLFMFAGEVEVSPTYISCIKNGSMNFSLGNLQIKKIAKHIGYEGPCFVVEQQTMIVAK